MNLSSIYSAFGSTILPVSRFSQTFGSTEVKIELESQTDVKALVIEDPYDSVMLSESGYQNKDHILVITQTELRCSDDLNGEYFDLFIYKNEAYQSFKCRNYTSQQPIVHYEFIARRVSVRDLPPIIQGYLLNEDGSFILTEGGGAIGLG